MAAEREAAREAARLASIRDEGLALKSKNESEQTERRKKERLALKADIERRRQQRGGRVAPTTLTATPETFELTIDHSTPTPPSDHCRAAVDESSARVQAAAGQNKKLQSEIISAREAAQSKAALYKETAEREEECQRKLGLTKEAIALARTELEAKQSALRRADSEQARQGSRHGGGCAVM